VSEPTRTLATVLSVILILFLFVPMLSGGMMMGGMMGPGMMGRWGGPAQPWGPWAAVFSALTLVGLVLLVVWAVRHLGSVDAGPTEQPIDILKRRYARGELTREQFEQMRHDLEGTAT
jgi:putative membrane protein